MANAIKSQPHLMKNAMKQLGGEGQQFKQMKEMKATATTLTLWLRGAVPRGTAIGDSEPRAPEGPPTGGAL